MQQVRLDGRTAIVTGAGHGLGRAHAMALAARGARVVVNDIDLTAAEAVANAIGQAGGQAHAQGGRAEEGGQIVTAAMDLFGGVDVVVNNAGIVRDAAFHKMTRADWDAVLEVHLTGAWEVTRAAWPYLRTQNWGRVLMTSSIAGIYGNFGQANYSTAKLGLLGMTRTLAIEGARHDIRVNAIAPLAASRLTNGVLPDSLLERLDPAHVSPLVVLLSSKECPVTGQLFEAAGGRFTRLRWQRSNPLRLGGNTRNAVELLLANWDRLSDYSAATYPETVDDGFALADTVESMHAGEQS